MSDSDRPTSLSPDTRIRLTVSQLITLVVALGGIGFSVGALWPKVAENEERSKSNREAMVKMTTVLERLDKEGERRDEDIRELRGGRARRGIE